MGDIRRGTVGTHSHTPHQQPAKVEGLIWVQGLGFQVHG